MNHITDLCNFLDLSPVNFWAVETVRQRLETAGFRQLDMRDEWVLTPGDKRYVVQNGSAIFAFVVGSDDAASGFNIIAAHSDSPGFRIKPRCEMACEGMVKLNTEVRYSIHGSTVRCQSPVVWPCAATTPCAPVCGCCVSTTPCW